MKTTTLCKPILLFPLLFGLAVSGCSAESPPDNPTTRELLTDLVAIPSTAETGRAREAAEYLAGRLLAAGFPDEDVRLLGPSATVGGLVVRLAGRDSARPVLLLAHLDVVPAVAEYWTSDPYVLVEREGFLYGRGSSDNKAGAATLIANLIRLRGEGFVPEQDLLAVLTLDEETNMHSIVWLLENHAPLADAEFALNTEPGSVSTRDGEPVFFGVQAAEKMYMVNEIRTENPGGHSSVPRPNNAIYSLAEAITRIAAYKFPVNLNDVTRAFFAASAESEDEPLATAMRALASDSASEDQLALIERSNFYTALLRTTCVATMLSGGHAENALPTFATVVVNCRILPQEIPDEVEATLLDVIADDSIKMRRTYEPEISPPSPLTSEILSKIAKVSTVIFPGITVLPAMYTSATDSLYTRAAGIPTYGFSAIADSEDGDNAHGIDERVGIAALEDSIEFWYRLLQTL